jgi:hypothetical protein
MASLNLSVNGPSIKSSYAGVVNANIAKSSSSTYAHWALFSVQAPLVSAFQAGGSKESVLKVQTTGEGELSELIEDFNDGRIQFAFVKVKDPNSGLPKNVLISWCGGGVPERTKGYFTSHRSAVEKILQGYHVEITARSDSDLEPESIIEKVSNASGAKYTAGGSAPVSSGGAPPATAKKPVFTPTTSSTGSSFNPIVQARNRRQENVDDDGWGADAPQVTRSQLEKVESAYKPTRVNMAELSKGRDESTRFNGGSTQTDRADVVKGAYQPIGKVDIAAIRAAAQKKDDDRPTTVKGAYEPVGKVDIAAIRAKAQGPSDNSDGPPTPLKREEPAEPIKSLADRTAAFTQSERLTELPKPKVAKKWGGASTFTGTKAPLPVGFGAPATPATPPVGSASRTFADQGGKTPAQLWAEKKARERGVTPTHTGGSNEPIASPVTAQKSGSEWKSGYAGKSWGAVQTTNFGRGGVETNKTGATDRSESRSEPEAPASPAGGIASIRDRFKDAPPMGGAAPAARQIPSHDQDDEPAPPALPSASRPGGGFALPGLPSRPPPVDEEEEQEREEEQHAPAIPSRDYEEEEQERPESPIRVAVPVARKEEVELEPAEQHPPPPLPQSVKQELPKEEELPEDEETHDPRAAAAAVAEQTFGQEAHDRPAPTAGGKTALIQYDYERAEDNEIDLVEGEKVTNIEMVDDDWWMGTNSKGESGLFPSNYVELMDDDDEAAHAAPVPPPAPAAAHEPEPEAASGGGGGATATALFDYEAAEDNELSFPEGAKIEGLEFPDEDWWFGHYKGQSGLFPANYVQLNA